MTRTRARASGRPARLLAAWLALALAFFVQHAIPQTALACSCMGPQPLEAYAEQPGTVILAGRVEDVDRRGAIVAVERWFVGGRGDAFALISGDFGNGASCGVGAVPKVGSEWIWVAFAGEDGGLRISICQPTADLATPEGQKLLAEAVETFGDVPGPPLPTPTTPPDPAAPVDPTPYLAAGGTVAVGLLILGGAALLGRRRRA